MDPLTRAIIDMCILLFSAKLIGVIFKKLGLPENIGFIFAGLLLGPSLFGSIRIGDFSLVELNDYIRVFAKLGAILLLFLVGLNISLIELKTNKTIFMILGFLGALSPLILGLIFYRILEKNFISTVIVSSAIATSSLPLASKLSRSIFTSSRVKIASNITIVDNIIGVLILSIILSFLEIGEAITLQNTVLLILKTLVFSLVLLITTIFLVPAIIKRIGAWGIYFGKQGGMIEVLITAMCFFYATLAYSVGLSPITGAIICGIAVAGSHILVRVKDYIEKISFLFAPIFFVIIGANIEFSSLSSSLIIIGVLLLSMILFFGNLIGSLIPAFFAFRDWKDAWVISLTRFSLGNVGLVIAGIGFNNSGISSNTYLQIVILAIMSFILNPYLLKRTKVTRIRKLE